MKDLISPPKPKLLDEATINAILEKSIENRLQLGQALGFYEPKDMILTRDLLAAVTVDELLDAQDLIVDSWDTAHGNKGVAMANIARAIAKGNPRPKRLTLDDLAAEARFHAADDKWPSSFVSRPDIWRNICRLTHPGREREWLVGDLTSIAGGHETHLNPRPEPLHMPSVEELAAGAKICEQQQQAARNAFLQASGRST